MLLSKLNPKVIILALLSVFLINIEESTSEKILIFVLKSSYSQLNVLHPYAVGLVKAGHEVTFLSPTPYKTPDSKIQYLLPDKVVEKWKVATASIGEILVRGREASIEAGEFTNRGWDQAPLAGIAFCRLLFESTGFKEWVGNNSKFDLVVIDGLYNDCGLGLSLKFKAPFIYFDTSAPLPASYDTFGVVPESSWHPDIRKRWTGELSFFRRVENVLSTLWMYLYHKGLSGYFQELENIFKEHLGLGEFPRLEDYEREASLIFYNSHFSMDYVRSLPPLYVPIGGLQCNGTEEQPLPESIANFINAHSGFIYVSFGTLVRLPKEKQGIFLKVFLKFPKIGFVMKWHGKLPTVVPKNALLLEYAPQQTFLANNKIIAFVSQGGMLSSQEAAYYGVPVIGLPVFADQDYNIEALRRRGAGIKLEIASLTAEELQSAIAEVLDNPSYKQSMGMVSKLYRDRPRHPLEDAVWWTGYVLRNSKSGAMANLKPLGIHYQSWFQRRCLDVWGFLFILSILIIYTAFNILKRIFNFALRLFCSSSKFKYE